ncbi:MAG TPA: asparaginase [Nitriliruptorales bacterium]
MDTTRRHVLHPERPHVVESRHLGHVVVVNPAGSTVLALGDPGRLTFVRSAAKPFQTTACLEALADNGVDLPPPDEVAVSWASHRGEPLQLATVARLLARSGRDASQLTCPSARPASDPGSVRRRLHHNCSGKHALFALAGDAVGCPPGRLLDPTAPLQKRVLGVLEAALGPAQAVSVDGCGAPTAAVPLEAIARAFAGLATHERWAHARAAGHAHPGLVGGRRRLESVLLARGLVAKPGAQGVFGVGWSDRDGGGWGLAVRAEDGDPVASATAVAGLLTAAGLLAVDAWAPPPVLGGGRPVGSWRPATELVEAASVLRGEG